MGRLIERLLRMARLDGGAEFDLQDVKIETLIGQVVTQFSLIAQIKGVLLTSQLSNVLPIIRVDEQEIIQALGEIVDNAITFTPGGGAVTIRAEVAENTIVITIQDTGIGISAEDLPHIFKRLHRGDTARSTERGAVGLGLSIAKQIIELHHGNIVVESALGEGSMFGVILPLR